MSLSIVHDTASLLKATTGLKTCGSCCPSMNPWSWPGDELQSIWSSTRRFRCAEWYLTDKLLESYWEVKSGMYSWLRNNWKATNWVAALHIPIWHECSISLLGTQVTLVWFQLLPISRFTYELWSFCFMRTAMGSQHLFFFFLLTVPFLSYFVIWCRVHLFFISSKRNELGDFKCEFHIIYCFA